MGVLARADALCGQITSLRFGADAVIADDPAVVQEGEALTVGGGFVRLTQEGVRVGHVRVSGGGWGPKPPPGLGSDCVRMFGGLDHFAHFAVCGGIDCLDFTGLQSLADGGRVEGGAL